MKRTLSLLMAVCILLCCGAACAETNEYKDKWNSEVQYILDHYLAYFDDEGLGEFVQPYDETVTLSIAQSYSAAQETRMAKFNERYGETFEENRWTYLYDKGLNIQFDYQWWAISGDDYNQKLRLEMAASNLPDVFAASQSDVLALAEAGMIMDVSELIENYMSESQKAILESDNGMGYDMVSYEGGVYGIPMRSSDTDNFSYLFLRKDWMEKLNLEWPETIDELETIIQAFMAADFDGNGKDDTVGMVLDKNVWYFTRGMFNAYGAYPEVWVETEDGTLAYGATLPEMKDTLTTLQNFYKSGYFDPEFATKDEASALESITSGHCGVVYGGHWLGYTFGDLHELDPESEWLCLTLPTGNGEAVRSPILPNISQWVCINANCKNPEAVIKGINMSDYGFFNANDSAWFSYEENNSRDIRPISSGVAATDNMDVYKMLLAMLETGDSSVLKGKAISYWGNFEKEDLEWEWKLMFGEGDTPLKVLCEAYDAGLTFYNAFVGPQNELMQERWSTINDELLMMTTKIILGEISVDEGFAQWLDTFNALGGAEITEYVNEWKSSVA